jgi:hypothetical protein
VNAHKSIPAVSNDPRTREPLYRSVARFDHPGFDATVQASATRDLVALAHDVAHGARTVMEILEEEEVTDEDVRMGNDEGESRPLLGLNDRQALRRLAIASLEMLGDAAERFGTRHFKQQPGDQP